MNYKQFLDRYNQGPEETYRLFKEYEKRIESLNGQLQQTDFVNQSQKQGVYVKKRIVSQVVNRDIKGIPFTMCLLLIMSSNIL